MQASWVTGRTKSSAVALGYGLDDFGSTTDDQRMCERGKLRVYDAISEMERLDSRRAGYRANAPDT